MEVREPGARYLVRREFKLTEAGSIPADWTSSTVGAEFHIQLGKMLDAQKNTGELKPFLGNRAVQWGHVDTADLGEIRLTPDDLQRFRLRAGDLLVCEGGEVGRAAIWTAPIVECYYQKALHRLRAKRGFNSALMLNLLRLYSASARLQNYVTQTSIAHLPKDKFETIPLPVPATTAEQNAIADALSDTDALIESLEQLLAKKRQIKQGAMQELLTGQRRLPGFPGEWSTVRLDRLGTVYGGLSGKTKVNFGRGSAQYIPFMNVMANPVIDSHWLERVEVAPDESQNLTRRGDLFFNGSSETPEEVGLCSVLLDEVPNLYLNSFCFGFRFRPEAEVVGLFWAYWFRSCAGRRAMSHLAQGATRYNISKAAFLRLGVPLIPFAEQTAIATTLSDMDAEISALDARLAKARQLKQGMMQALLTGRIRLVPPQEEQG